MNMSVLFLVFSLISLFGCILDVGHAFTVIAPNKLKSDFTFIRTRIAATVVDYEYIPPEKSGNTRRQSSFQFSDLKSVYPDGTPATLRGEAVRSAIRSGQCIGWTPPTDDNAPVILSLTGKGTCDFLNSKLTQSFPLQQQSSSKTACLLNPKGQLIDVVGVVVMPDDNTAFVMPSPGHSSKTLFERLDPFIFPMDQVKLNLLTENTFQFTLLSTKASHVQTVTDDFITPHLPTSSSQQKQQQLPKAGQCLKIDLNTEHSSYLVIVPLTGFPTCAGPGYTFLFVNDAEYIGKNIWKRHLVSESNNKGPVEIGPAEYESLRIEVGMPSYGKEMMAGLVEKKKRKKSPTSLQPKEKEESAENEEVANESEKKSATAAITPASPLELNLQNLVDTDKGCYLGQEGIASTLKNPRGPPRTLYQVVFDDEFNQYDEDDNNSKKNKDNPTRIPKAGDDLFVLGSNEEINVGTITSVAEPGSTGDPVTICLALIRRADSIKSQMKNMDIEMPKRIVSPDDNDFSAMNSNGGGGGGGGGGIIPPPPLDPLDGLEVIVGNTYTVGRLQMVPSRKYQAILSSKGLSSFSMFDNVVPQFVENLPGEEDSRDLLSWQKQPDRTQRQEDQLVDIVEDAEIVTTDDTDDEKMAQEFAKAEEEAKAAAAEAKRKAEKMEMLRKRAEEAMARRKQKQQQKD